MADTNPIKYSDLIQPDDSIEKLAKQLELANQEYTTLAQNVKAQAVSIANSLKDVSGATELGRKSTVNLSTAAERLLRAERELEFSRTETAKKIQELNALRKKEQTEIKLTEQLNRSAEGSYDRLAAQYGLLKMQLNAMSEAQRKGTQAGRDMEKQAAAIYEEMKKLQEATGKHVLNVGNYQSALQGLLPIQGKFFTNLQMLGGLMEGGVKNGIKLAGEQVAIFGKQLLALLANPIVATIAAITAAFMALAKGISSSEENTRALERILAPFQRILTGIVGVLQEVAGWLLKGVEGMEKMAMAASRFAERLPIVGKYLRSVNDALEDNVRLTREKQELENLERTYSVQNARMAANAAKWKAEAEKTSDPARRAKLLKMAQAAETTAMNNELQLAKKDLEIKRQRAAQSQNDTQTMNELAQAEAHLAEVEQQYYQRQIRMNSKLRRENEKMAKPEKGGSTNTKSGVDEAQKIADEKLAIERKTAELRLKAIEDDFTREQDLIVNAYNVQIEDLRKKGEKEVALREAINAQIQALETEKNMKLADLVVKYADKETAERKKIDDQKKKATEDTYRALVQIVDLQTDLQQAEIDNMQGSEQRKTELRLKAERDRLQKIYDLNLKAGKDIESLEMRLLQEQMKKLDQEVEKNKKNKDIFDLMGFNLDDDKKQAITDSFSFALEQLNSYIDAWVQAAEKKVALADKEVESAQRALDAEREARANGYASNVAYAQKELDNAKKNQQKALAEQERAQKAQQALATVQQATNLISASALIWAQLGFPWAIPAIAVMWGSFAAAKIKAAQVTSQGNTEEYGEGTVELLEGGSHQSGNDIDLGRKKNGTRRRAEGGEFFAVINKRNSRKYRHVIPDIIHSLNGGTFEQKYAHAYDGVEQVAVNMHEGTRPDLRRLGDDVRAIREQGDRRTYSDERGTHVVYKNLHRIIHS